MRESLSVLALVLLFHLPFSVQDAGGTRGGTIVHEEGWAIAYGEVVVLRDAEVLVWGDLWIGGSLRLFNVSLTVTQNTSIVGSMFLDDGDGDKRTNDSSVFQCKRVLIYEDGLLSSNLSVLRNVRTYEGSIRLNGSLLEGELNGGTLDVSGSEIIGDVRFPGPGSVVRDSIIRKGTLHLSDTVFDLDRTYFTQTIRAIEVENSTVTIRDSEFMNCTQGIVFGSDCQIILRYDRFLRTGKALLRQPNGSDDSNTVNSFGCEFDEAPLSLGDATAYLYSNTFNASTLEGIGGGVVVENEFNGCHVAIESPQYASINRNMFDGCRFAISNTSSCLIYHNSFLWNHMVFYGFDTTTRWNSSKEGNYYVTYTGMDDGSGGRREGDGIGDTNIPYLGVDHHPLTQDHYWYMPPLIEIDADYIPGSPNITVRISIGEEYRYIVQDSSSGDFTTDLRTISSMRGTIIVPDCANGTHHLRARAYNEYGSKGWSLPVLMIVDQLPLPPVPLGAVPLPEGGMVNLSWRYVGEDVQSVFITVRDLAENISYGTFVEHPTDKVIIQDLTNGVPYEFGLRSVDAAGRPSRYTHYIQAIPIDTVPTDPPRNIILRPLGNTSILVSWSPPKDQDLQGYQVMRSTDGQDFSLITTLPTDTLSYADTDLMDNTTYHYGIIAIDDDGPMSSMGGPVSARTLHNNNAPIMVGDILLAGIEGNPPLRIDLSKRFIDPDGDRIFIALTGYSLFESYLDGDNLVVDPGQDQNGEGYVELRVDDGEEVVPFLIWVQITPMPDPVVIRSIVSPFNGSVLLPGRPVLLNADVEDPDIPHDRIAVTWSSDIDGILSANNASIFNAVVVLSPGIHRMTLTVRDETGLTDTLTWTVAVSLWGFKEAPWSVMLDREDSFLEPTALRVKAKIANEGPLLLTFRCRLDILGGDKDIVLERVIVLGPGTVGTIQFASIADLTEGDVHDLVLTVQAETSNGTFAGSRTDSYGLEVEPVEGNEGDLFGMIMIAGLIVIAILFVVVIYLLLSFRKTYKRDDRIDEIR